MSGAAEKTETVRVVQNIGVPAAKVYEGFTDPAVLVHWIGPGGAEATRVETGADGTTDVWVMKEEGEKLHFHWEIAESDPPVRLVLDFAFGGPIGSELTTERTLVTLDIVEKGPEETELTLTHDRLTADQAEGVSKGWPTVTGRLVTYLEATEGVTS